MKQHLHRCVIAATLAALAAVISGEIGLAQEDEEETIFWHTSLEKAKAAAKAANKPMFLEFRCAP